MEPEKPEQGPRLASKWKEAISTIFWMALIIGVTFATACYFGIFSTKTSSGVRDEYIREAMADTLSTFARRFLLGAAGGAVVGVLMAIRDILGDKKPK